MTFLRVLTLLCMVQESFSMTVGELQTLCDAGERMVWVSEKSTCIQLFNVSSPHSAAHDYCTVSAPAETIGRLAILNSSEITSLVYSELGALITTNAWVGGKRMTTGDMNYNSWVWEDTNTSCTAPLNGSYAATEFYIDSTTDECMSTVPGNYDFYDRPCSNWYYRLCEYYLISDQDNSLCSQPISLTMNKVVIYKFNGTPTGKTAAQCAMDEFLYGGCPEAEVEREIIF